MQNRRNFLKQASLMLAGGLVAPQLLSSCGGKSGQAAATASESSKYIGIWRQQAMITVRFTV